MTSAQPEGQDARSVKIIAPLGTDKVDVPAVEIVQLVELIATEEEAEPILMVFWVPVAVAMLTVLAVLVPVAIFIV